MKKFRLAYVIPALLLLTLGMVVGVEIGNLLPKQDLKQLKKLEDAYLTITRYYVDQVDAGKLAEDAIQGMLHELDPHSAYISNSEIEEVQEEYQGSFGGVGIWFEIIEDTARVVSTVADGPSDRAGVMAGDRIIGVNDSSAVGFTNRDVQKRLKGPVGTRVGLRLARPGGRRPIDVTIERERIKLETVDSAYMLDEQTGYVRVSRFAMTTFKEFMDQVGALRAQGMRRMVLDLRGNPGGVMDGAISMADEMLPGGRTIVYTQSRHTELNSMHKATEGGALEDLPVIVLVSPYSASASEIVAGALQDNDRALIVGQRTFGKGLVQQQFRLPDGSVLQMTVSRYYTPAGRLIQTPYADGDQEDYYAAKFSSYEDATYHPADYIESIPDSLKFKTTSGRTVFGGGGIMPDYVVAPDTTDLEEAVARNGYDYLFVREWFERHEREARARWGDKQPQFVQAYRVEGGMWQEFTAFLAGKDLHTAGAAPGGAPDAAALAAARPVLEARLKAYLARQLYGAEASTPLFNAVDPVLEEAMKLWNNALNLSRAQVRKP